MLRHINHLSNIITSNDIKPTHLALLNEEKSNFLSENYFYTDADILHFSGWLLSSVKNVELLKSFQQNLTDYIDKIKPTSILCNGPIPKVTPPHLDLTMESYTLYSQDGSEIDMFKDDSR